MGARGQLKLPSHLRAVTDRTQAGTVAEVTPRSAPEQPKAVAADPELSALWDEIVPGLDKAGLIAPSDGPTVEMCLRHLQLARRAAAEIGVKVTMADLAHSGTRVKGQPIGRKKHPAEAVFRLESAAFLRYAQQLGMTFVARARTPAAKVREGGDENPFAAPVVNG